MTDTIFALSSGAPPAALAVVRISGPAAFAAVSALAGGLPSPRRASLRRLRHPGSGETLDRALVLCFPGPGSATGEDLAELHLHGGRAVVRAVEAALRTLAGCRGAEAGEFTRRALEAGRLDLTEAEGLADLLAAETEAQHRAALRSAEGGLRRRIEDWSDRTVAISAMVEAAIDHSDEDDAADEAALIAPARDAAGALAVEIAILVAQPTVERLRDGIRVVLAGPPNSGKSSLFNMLVGRDAAIVSPIAGTTRDRIEAPVAHAGLAWLLTDTAGLVDATDDPIEAIGVDRARASADAADILLWLGDGEPPASMAQIIKVHPRCDQAGRRPVPEGRVGSTTADAGGAAAVWAALQDTATRLVPTGDVPALNTRQRDLCCDAEQYLYEASSSGDTLIVAENLRLARLAFDRITGRSHVEDVLDALFGRFCIGK
ncbi:tRNA uridine-5-carboxymethylaminomethyl(34) synthesis GTPase MnmE [Sphingomonas sp.]|uniref:tRNA uridine-5-carboxymethylaminomethyl(34) synthesis GTPase MnmE n=1 Tax=Sphingomonas sp. TaxID=28214 RepID=UPI002DD6B061|nr:tRNA uridine-5-carboxymethylaminomethyl(34) synthesis GTPase MnmE [Sphingomonas sp.]